jgi:glycosyltransferase involved in cell wall biosynthesis
MREPLVSVVIPVFNSEEFLRPAVDSVLAQRYRPLQIIAVDDGSTDASLSILQSYGDQIEIYQQPNAGSAVARNKGIKQSNGEFVAFLDADDVWHPDKTSIQIAHLKEHLDIGLVYASLLKTAHFQNSEIDRFLLTPVEGAIEIDPRGSGWRYTNLLRKSGPHTSSLIMRRSVIDRVGEFDSRLRRGQDYDYWIRASRATKFHKLQPKLSVYRIHKKGVTQTPSPLNYEAIVIESALQSWGREGPDGSKISQFDIQKRLSGLWFDFAYLHEKKGDMTSAKSAFLRSFRYLPWRVRALAKYFLCQIKS